MVKHPGATCPGSPGGAIAGLGQVRHRLGSGVDLEAGGVGHGAGAEELRDRAPMPTSTVGFSAHGLAAESAATLCDSGGKGGPPNFTELFAGDLTAARNPAGQEQLSSTVIGRNREKSGPGSLHIMALFDQILHQWAGPSLARRIIARGPTLAIATRQ
jgi:hypothetical protein